MRLDFLIGFIAEALAILILAKLARDLVLKWRGYDVNDMVARKGSVGAATSQAGYLVGVLLGFLGAVSAGGNTTSFLGIAGHVALAGLVAIALQLVADIVSDKLIFRGLMSAAGPAKAAASDATKEPIKDGPKAGVEDVNIALAVGKAAVSIATGLVLRGAMSDPETGLLARVVWFAAAQAVMVVAALLYFRITPYDDLAEIKRNNLAAGFPIAGILLAAGFVLETAVSGKPTASAGESALQAGKFLGVSLLLVYLIRWITSLTMLPKVKLSKAIVDDKNVAAGIQEGLSFLLAAFIVTFFLG
jgi:uncharacterized membrane protein YjfL (UPF0719 family)